jgi:hypothetical protein
MPQQERHFMPDLNTPEGRWHNYIDHLEDLGYDMDVGERPPRDSSGDEPVGEPERVAAIVTTPAEEPHSVGR